MSAEIIDLNPSNPEISKFTPPQQPESDLKEVLENREKLKYKEDLLRSVVNSFFNNEHLSYYCGEGEKECSDGSNLYILTKEGIIKVGCGEFNRDTFINGVYGYIDKKYLEKYRFKDSPLPLYVVNQGDSHFARGKVKELREQKPIEYLEEYTVLSYNPEDKSVFSNFYQLPKDKEKVHINEDSIIGIYDAILLFRNKFISDFDKDFVKNYMSYLQSLTLDELTQYAQNSGKITDKNEATLRNIIYRKMGCSITGAGIYDEEAIKSRYNLIQSFDTNKGEFTSIPEFNDNK